MVPASDSSDSDSAIDIDPAELPDPADRLLSVRDAWHLVATVESSRDAIVGVDLEGRVVGWSQGAEAIFGFEAEAMVGRPVERMIPPECAAEWALHFERLRRGERIDRCATLRLARDGRRIEVSITQAPVRDGHGRIVGAAAILRDLQAHERQEHEIERLNRLYAALSHVNQAIVWATGRDELFRQVCRVLVEQGGLRMAWIGLEDSARQRLQPVAEFGDSGHYLDSMAVSTDEGPLGQGPSGRCFRSGSPAVCNDLLEDPMNLPWRAQLQARGFRAVAAFAIRQQGRVCGTLNVYADRAGFFHDKEVTLLAQAARDLSFALDNFERDAARRQAEQAVHQEMLFSDAMLESMPGVVYFYDENGRFLRWNRNFEAVSGCSAAQIAGMHPLDFFAGADKAQVAQRIAQVFAGGEASVEADFVARDGRTTPYFFTGRRIDFQGRTCLVGVGIDISQRRQAEAALRELNAGLEHKVAERTDELHAALLRAEAADRIKSAFLATMSHELRTPLNSIIGFTGILLQGLAGPLNGEQDKQLGMVRSSARHLLALVNDVLDISKIEAGQLEVAWRPFDPRRSIDKVIGVVSTQAGAKGLALRAAVAGSLGQACGDERRFEQILLNLLSNAIKFTDQGEIVVSAELRADPAAPASDAAAPMPLIHVDVADSGSGIRADDLSQLFQPFRQIESGLARVHEGTGLGLAICQRLARLLGGRIEVASEWGRGSVFSLSLPLCGPQPSTPTGGPRAP